jgi:hypothetical protein
MPYSLSRTLFKVTARTFQDRRDKVCDSQLTDFVQGSDGGLSLGGADEQALAT